MSHGRSVFRNSLDYSEKLRLNTVFSLHDGQIAIDVGRQDTCDTRCGETCQFYYSGHDLLPGDTNDLRKKYGEIYSPTNTGRLEWLSHH